MRLKSIKLAGFKSFVDPTTVPVSGNLIGIVGPNGCGKSNIIDAIRWVMGESSAKHLRGDSMADVIFNGSSARKPVGRASVELLFDNTDGSAPGQYARYAEISIRRENARDGRSEYSLNKARCRRKDITDLFLGTGLGARAYSIIEQDMVSRIVEAKPDELRVFFEEAAGISKYRERRRETENRIRHTRENLARVEDIRSELETQLRRLRRQSRAAARYKELKREERLARAQWLALRWRNLDAQVQEADRAIAGQENTLEHAIAGQRSIEAKIEKIRAQQTEASERFNNVQAEFYSIGTEIASVEQAIQHARDTHNQRVRELEQVTQSWDEASTHLAADLQKLKQLGHGLEQGAPQISEAMQQGDQAADVLQRSEQSLSAWQADWDVFAEAAAEPGKLREIQHARIQQLQQHMSQLNERQDRLVQEAKEITSALQGVDLGTLKQQATELEEACNSAEQQLQSAEGRIKGTQARDTEMAQQLETSRGEHHQCNARLTSLRELQAAAEGKHDAVLSEWLTQRGLDKAPRLAGLLSVAPGWERAVERVLGTNLAAVCVRGLDQFVDDLKDGEQRQLAMLDLNQESDHLEHDKRPMLLDKVKADANLVPLLAGIYVSEDLDQALTMRTNLASHEATVTRVGTLVGRNWLSMAGDENHHGGMLARKRELEELATRSRALDEKLNVIGGERARLRETLENLEGKREQSRRQLSEKIQERTAFQEQRAHKEATFAQLQVRAEQLEREQDEVRAQLGRDSNELDGAQRLLQEAEGQTDTQDRRRRELLEKRERLQAKLEQARVAAAEAREALHRLEVDRQGMQTAFESTRQSVTRLEGQLKQLVTRREELGKLVTENEKPGTELKGRLEEFLGKRLQVEKRLNEARKNVADLDTALREQEQARTQQEHQVQEIRQVHEEARVSRQELVARRDGLAEQIGESGVELNDVIDGLPAEASEEAWQTRIEELQTKVERLGPINLVAIEEYDEQSERKGYLDKQHNDLSEALATLEDAIRKMDRESRARFKETFDKVNAGFQSFFPQLFGGGNAYLELTETDLLSTGVTVMARPPGKRNSTIHLLSGGEKALTAVALLFALFELNPAPFCLLDEVDAPLDDANVERYCETVKTLSQKTQLIYVTHNKISMETAKVLIGVTMTEPGVSRLVAVDVDEALEMAAQ